MAFGDYMMIIENDEGREITRFLQSNDRQLPRQGEGIVVLADDVRNHQDLVHLVGRYLVRQIDYETPPSALGRSSYNKKIPFCYVRVDRGQGMRTVSAERSPVGFTAVPGDLDPAVALEIARRDRQLAGLIDDIADEVALHINEGAPLDRSLVERLAHLRSMANRSSVSALVHAKVKRKRRMNKSR
jgi:hypothetical protein